VVAVSASSDGQLLASVSEDGTAKVFDVVNFGELLLVLLQTYFTLSDEDYGRYDQHDQAGFHSARVLLGPSTRTSAGTSSSVSNRMLHASSPHSQCRRSDRSSGTIRIYDGRGGDEPLLTTTKLHRFPVHVMTVR
jgi:peptidylprolyl isomerase domain and WD repeat-containing protein 1